jgi:sugar lactone lactonase YvrE
MSSKLTTLLTSLGFALPLSISALASDDHGLPNDLAFSTLITTPLVIEGLTGDDAGNLYAPGRQAGNGVNCPIWRVNVAVPSLVVVGYVPAPSATTQCSPSGLTFNDAGAIFISEGDKIYTFTPNASSPPVATVFASGVPGTNGVAFDRRGNLWTGDGTTGQGRVWKISPNGLVVTEVFRVQPMSNEVNLATVNSTTNVPTPNVGGVGRDVRTLPPGLIQVTPTSRNAFVPAPAAGQAAQAAGSQPLVANGLQFNRKGDLFIADTARGAIWKVRFDRHGNLESRVGCDTTFTANTLCLDNVFVAHPYLEGADGIFLDKAGNIWVDANERNAVVVVTDGRKVVELFRNQPDPTTLLRNTGPLETPTSPFLIDGRVCTANSDGNRRDNSPSTAGEIGGVGQPRGKISCASL